MRSGVEQAPVQRQQSTGKPAGAGKQRKLQLPRPGSGGAYPTGGKKRKHKALSDFSQETPALPAEGAAASRSMTAAAGVAAADAAGGPSRPSSAAAAPSRGENGPIVSPAFALHSSVLMSTRRLLMILCAPWAWCPVT